MREIKFRAWDDTAKDIVTWEEILEANDMEKVFSEPDYYGLTAVMQFTGLKDKNGVEIYEGDIVQWANNPKDECDEWGVVDYAQGHFLAHLYSSHGGEGYEFIERINQKKPQFEVIGNIYENPELLK